MKIVQIEPEPTLINTSPNRPKEAVTPMVKKMGLKRQNELERSTLQEAERDCPEETKKRCFERVEAILIQRSDPNVEFRHTQRHLISQSPIMIRGGNGNVKLDDLQTPDILKSRCYDELSEEI